MKLAIEKQTHQTRKCTRVCGLQTMFCTAVLCATVIFGDPCKFHVSLSYFFFCRWFQSLAAMQPQRLCYQVSGHKRKDSPEVARSFATMRRKCCAATCDTQNLARDFLTHFLLFTDSNITPRCAIRVARTSVQISMPPCSEAQSSCQCSPPHLSSSFLNSLKYSNYRPSSQC